MKNIIKEYTMNKIFSKIEKGDVLTIIANKQYFLKILKVNPDSVIGDLNNKLYLIKKDALQGKTLYFSRLKNNSIIASGKIENVINVRIIRGYNTVEKVSTKLPKLTKKRLDFLKETFIDLKDNIKKIKVGDQVIFETAFLKTPENEDDDELIDETSISNITIDINGEPKDGYFKGNVVKITGYETKKYSMLLNLEVVFNSNGLSFSKKADGSDKSGSYLKIKKLNTQEISYISNIVNIEIINDGAEIDTNNIGDEEKHFTDKEIFNIVANDPVMSKLLNRKPNFWDFILGKSHEQSIDDMTQTLRDIKSKLNKNNKPNNLTSKVYTMKFISDDVSGNPKFKLIKGNKYTIKVLSITNRKTIIGIYLLNSINKDHNIYTMDIFDSLRKGSNKGKIYYGGKTENKTRKFVGNGEIMIL